MTTPHFIPIEPREGCNPSFPDQHGYYVADKSQTCICKTWLPGTVSVDKRPDAYLIEFRGMNPDGTPKTGWHYYWVYSSKMAAEVSLKKGVDSLMTSVLDVDESSTVEGRIVPLYRREE